MSSPSFRIFRHISTWNGIRFVKMFSFLRVFFTYTPPGPSILPPNSAPTAILYGSLEKKKKTISFFHTPSFFSVSSFYMSMKNWSPSTPPTPHLIDYPIATSASDCAAPLSALQHLNIHPQQLLKKKKVKNTHHVFWTFLLAIFLTILSSSKFMCPVSRLLFLVTHNRTHTHM